MADHVDRTIMDTSTDRVVQTFCRSVPDENPSETATWVAWDHRDVAAGSSGGECGDCRRG
ncbi:hypothetical protein B1756_02205 [Natrarchaeobaculum aegyptiacum]|uniref:Uncharacterized protein n=1 Tax=Natrarchaeobaculum aegyptiacum TaxID=745377 RepID=A0A2Z2HQ15_9EURY|nr:hypothetical protein B1756_02205 [Natrarchaeobaculum aegyptiacum]